MPNYQFYFILLTYYFLTLKTSFLGKCVMICCVRLLLILHRLLQKGHLNCGSFPHSYFWWRWRCAFLRYDRLQRLQVKGRSRVGSFRMENRGRSEYPGRLRSEYPGRLMSYEGRPSRMKSGNILCGTLSRSGKHITCCFLTILHLSAPATEHRVTAEVQNTIGILKILREPIKFSGSNSFWNLIFIFHKKSIKRCFFLLQDCFCKLSVTMDQLACVAIQTQSVTVMELVTWTSQWLLMKKYHISWDRTYSWPWMTWKVSAPALFFYNDIRPTKIWLTFPHQRF